jgi:hypothetical protein
MKLKIFLFLVFALSAVVLSACGTVANLAEVNEGAVVIAERAQIRSSGAVVAADLLEVKRGNRLELLGEDNFNDEKWYNVRAFDENSTEGWIESRYVLADKLLAESQKLAEETKDIQTQATGQLRAATNLRLSPDRHSDDNILQKLKGGDTFDIIGWKRIPKPVNTEEDEKDDKTKNVANKQDRRTRRQREKDANEPLRLDDKYETWYQVRMQPAISPAPVGWIYGKQVDLAVPADIIFYRTGREFVAWGRLDGKADSSSVDSYAQSSRDASKEGKPGSWVILERSNRVEEPDGEEPDFDHILVLGYDKDSQDHYKVYLSGKVKGFLPLHVNGIGDTRSFTVRIKGSDGDVRDFTFKSYKSDRGLLKVNVPEGIPKEDKNDR